MEFVGNQINFKNVMATLIVAFFIGRVNLFGGTFPASIALITVMIAVSTVYIYLVPVLTAAMLTFAGQGVDVYGDLMAMMFCGVFFLFFHNHKFSINQRTAVAVAVMIFFNCAYFAWENVLHLLSLQTLVAEGIAIMVYIRVFNTLARTLFVRKTSNQISGEKTGIAVEILAVSLIGSVSYGLMVFPLWVFAVLVVQFCKGIQWSFSMAAFAAIYWQCQFAPDTDLFFGLFTGLMLGWFTASLFEGKYRKTLVAASVFGVMAFVSGIQIYGMAVVAALFVAVPSEVLVKFWCSAEEFLLPRAATEADLRLQSIKRDLLKKKETFHRLGSLYNRGKDNKQIISYQFEGMARTVDGILKNLEGSGEMQRGRGIPAFLVGNASYAFESVSGDSSLSFSFGENSQALIISDGMGKGQKAAVESNMVVTTLSRLLEAGFDVELAVKTVNSILMTDNRGEMFATVDLAIINKETGRTRIFKMGAASTFIKHQGKVSALKRPAPPVGILEGVKLEYIDVRLKRGDLLIMVSDGVTDCDRADPECGWLRERLMEIGSRDPETVAELIVNKAAEKYGIRERDDLTVMVAAI